jgi:hypothetical protein
MKKIYSSIVNVFFSKEKKLNYMEIDLTYSKITQITNKNVISLLKKLG